MLRSSRLIISRHPNHPKRLLNNVIQSSATYYGDDQNLGSITGTAYTGTGRTTIIAFASSSKRYMASSTAFVGYIPNSVKEAVKTTILDEVSKHDSTLWSPNGSNSSSRNNSKSISQTTKSSSTQSNNNHQHHNLNHEQHSSTSTNLINDPISLNRYSMLYDPLDEWYLHSQPGSILLINNNDQYTTSTIKTNYDISAIQPTLSPSNDPFILSQKDISSLSYNIRRDLIGKDHPVLTQVAGYFFEDGKDGGKKIRPMMVILLSRAMAYTSNRNTTGTSNSTINTNEDNSHDDELFTSQKRLAEISEMIHTASLFHDDVIDKAETRRGSPAVHQIFGNKMAILAGDYLLARASVFLARLRDVEVVETMSTIIEHLVRGEVMQMKGSSKECDNVEDRLVHYLRKNFYKTASLMANSCKSAAILGDYDDNIIEGAYKYGKHLGVSFQLVDDVLDFDGSASDMGKAALADLNAGLATAPVLFAAEKFPDEIQPMMDRKFRYDGDVEKTVQLVRQTDGIQRTKDLAQVHVELAIESIVTSLQPSVYRDALVHLAHKVVDRTR